MNIFPLPRCWRRENAKPRGRSAQVENYVLMKMRNLHIRLNSACKWAIASINTNTLPHSQMDGRTDRQSQTSIPPLTSSAGGIKIRQSFALQAQLCDLQKWTYTGLIVWRSQKCWYSFMVHLSLHLLFKQLSKIPMICTLSPGEAEALGNCLIILWSRC